MVIIGFWGERGDGNVGMKGGMKGGKKMGEVGGLYRLVDS